MMRTGNMGLSCRLLASSRTNVDARAFGGKLSGLTADERRAAKASGGVLVESVDSGSAAADAGIERGDIVLEVGKTRIGGMSDYNRAVLQFKGSSRAILFRINRGGSVLYIAVGPGE